MRPEDRIQNITALGPEVMPGILDTLILQLEKKHMGKCEEYECRCQPDCYCEGVCSSDPSGNCLSQCECNKTPEDRGGQYHG